MVSKNRDEGKHDLFRQDYDCKAALFFTEFYLSYDESFGFCVTDPLILQWFMRFKEIYPSQQHPLLNEPRFVCFALPLHTTSSWSLLPGSVRN
jgi:hypothetical protein